MINIPIFYDPIHLRNGPRHPEGSLPAALRRVQAAADPQGDGRHLTRIPQGVERDDEAIRLNGGFSFFAD